jgi:hypothetical protein
MFANDRINGYGTLTKADGTTLVGIFRNDRLNGMATVTMPDGSSYSGNWRNGTMSGQGTLTASNGERYVGEWLNGKQNGRGTYINNAGKATTGIWRDGVLIPVAPPIRSAQGPNVIRPQSLEALAKQGNAEAQYQYGMKFISGQADQMQPRIALEWLLKAAAQGHESAKKQVAGMYDLGVRMSALESSIQLSDSLPGQGQVVTPSKTP